MACPRTGRQPIPMSPRGYANRSASVESPERDWTLVTDAQPGAPELATFLLHSEVTIETASQQAHQPLTHRK